MGLSSRCADGRDGSESRWKRRLGLARVGRRSLLRIRRPKRVRLRGPGLVGIYRYESVSLLYPGAVWLEEAGSRGSRICLARSSCRCRRVGGVGEERCPNRGALGPLGVLAFLFGGVRSRSCSTGWDDVQLLQFLRGASGMGGQGQGDGDGGGRDVGERGLRRWGWEGEEALKYTELRAWE